MQLYSSTLSKNNIVLLQKRVITVKKQVNSAIFQYRTCAVQYCFSEKRIRTAAVQYCFLKKRIRTATVQYCFSEKRIRTATVQYCFLAVGTVQKTV